MGEDFAFARTRPLMALCAELRDKYSLLVTHEDAPGDRITEVGNETHLNGRTFLFPKWNSITFHMRPGLPLRAEPTAPLGGVPDQEQSLAAVQEVVSQYNESGNPGTFTAAQDGEYIHIAETKRSLSGKLQPFEPVTTTVVTWQPKSGTCQQILNDLFADLQKLRNVTVVEGAVPIGALLAIAVRSRKPRQQLVKFCSQSSLVSERIT